MENLFNFGLFVFTSFITLVNPLGVMPVFMSMTADLEKKEKRKTAIKAITTAFATLLLFAFGGEFLFHFFGISTDSLRVVGGVIFFIMGYEMLNARLSSFKDSPESVTNYVDDISITPLGIPMLAGPGSITNAIVLMEDASGFNSTMIFIIALLITMLVTLLMLLGASEITKFLGRTGTKILMKIMGLIVMVIAVEFFFAGLTPFIQNLLH